MSETGSKVLVTGGTGLVGNNVIRKLIERGASVRALVRSSAVSEPFVGLDVEKIQGDLRDAATVRRAAKGTDVIVHSAGVVNIGWSYAGRMREVNVGGTQNVVDAARAAGARLVHISTVNTLAVPDKGDPPASEVTPFTGREVAADYVVTKLEADEVITNGMMDGLSATIVYPGFVLGPYDWKPSSGRMMNAIATRFLPMAPSGGITISDSRDLAEVIVGICHRPPPHDHYIVADHNIPYFDLWCKMAEVTGSRRPLWRMKAPIRRIAGWAGDIWGRIVRDEPEVNSALLAMSRQFHYYDSERAKKELGYQPRPLDETLRDAWEWLRQQPVG